MNNNSKKQTNDEPLAPPTPTADVEAEAVEPRGLMVINPALASALRSAFRAFDEARGSRDICFMSFKR